MAKQKITAAINDYHALTKKACNLLPHIIVLEGSELYLRIEAERKIQAALKNAIGDFETVVFYGPANRNDQGIKIAALLDELNSNSLFTSNRLMIIRQADLVIAPERSEETSKSKQTPEHLFSEKLESLPDSIWLLFSCDKLSAQRICGKALQKHAFIIPCPSPRFPRDATQYLIESAKIYGKSLDPNVAAKMVEVHGLSFDVLMSELDKLILHSGENETITQDDFNSFLTGSVQFEVFALTNAIEARNSKDAVLAAHRISTLGIKNQDNKRIGSTESTHMALMMIAGSVERLCRIKNAIQKGNHEEVLRISGHPFRAEKLSEAANRYSHKELTRAAEAVNASLHASHNTGGDPSLELERLALLIPERDS